MAESFPAEKMAKVCPEELAENGPAEKMARICPEEEVTESFPEKKMARVCPEEEVTESSTAEKKMPKADCTRTLIIGATGFIGGFIAEACLASSRPTYILVRPGSNSPSKAKAIRALQDKGAIILHGSIGDQNLMEKILKEHKIDVVISAIGGDKILAQLTLIDAMKSVGTIKRFLPSEFGHDIDRADPVEPGLTLYNVKRRVRRMTEAASIPFTYICCNSIAAWPYYNNTHPSEVLPPLDHFQIYGDGTVKGIVSP
uniref:NmrA-like domain-containing protein n=1 Tax=Nelumbo nucifera TaxID=4432 RepID=A0A822YUL5_NELNU|nr:TPA_asm: hypothetical protein HUJ06_005891 [Nelumbo nucifera]